jgi:predicted DsbA family dithiol-disulfide isomerase
MSSLRLLEVDSPEPARDADGALVLDWWCDLQCPDCRDGLEILDALQERFGDSLVLRLRHFPLTNHVWAVAAAVSQLAAAQQGRGEDYTAHALNAIDEIEGPADYVELAEHLGLDADAVAEALFDGVLASAVRDDYEAGRALGVLSTPTYVVDGLLVDASKTLDGAQEALESRIAAALGV